MYNENLTPETPKELQSMTCPNPHETLPIEIKSSGIDLPIALRKPPRSCTLHPIFKFLSYNTLSMGFHTFSSNLDNTEMSKNIQEAMTILKWKDDVLEEMQAREKNNTWDVVELSRGKRLVGCKWVFSVKYKADGTVERFKARLIAKGANVSV
ncbi:unnamed protein product [Fraxinus pennsylvanica]|uniref:Mitochondrial protein n=1 Tax=Fraxinus pennsylvanica TaxID=56036 RepID=A0AAD1YVF9_9LAMI|nr:unnamed protein product [Fraxinus pennsylvanica]